MFAHLLTVRAGCFALMKPKAWIWVRDVVQNVVDHYTARGYTLVRPFLNSIFPAATWNFPPVAACCDHTDPGNGRCTDCTITSLGKYDADRSGALILFDLRLIIRFPAGSTVRICSGGMRHGNTAIHPDDSRASFIQYFSGGLKRHIDYGYRSEKYLAEKKPKELRRVLGHAADRACEAMDLFSTPASLDRDRQLLL
jgi:hypothetical protein